jgi:hypothetical protein
VIYHLTIQDIRAQKKRIISTVDKAMSFYDTLDELEMDILGLKKVPEKKIKFKKLVCLCSFKKGKLIKNPLCKVWHKPEETCKEGDCSQGARIRGRCMRHYKHPGDRDP